MSEVMFCTEQGAMFVPNETEIPDLKSKDTFKKATVVRGTYFFYKNQDYNSAGIDKNLQIKEGETKDISEFNGSFYALPYQQQGIVLFALPYFNGYHKVTIKLKFPKIIHVVSEVTVLKHTEGTNCFLLGCCCFFKFVIGRKQRMSLARRIFSFVHF